ncbi:MAG: hypothetical protein NTX25_18160 [Proteobacteria bacterium]|nr:hypothetical protein [Pseudomonadota bacterium]
MPSSELNKTVRRPLLASLASADAEFNKWVTSRGYHELSDTQGGVWQFIFNLVQLPHPDDTQAILYKLQISLIGELTQANLLSTGVCKPNTDARLLSLLGPDKISISMKPRVFESESLDTLRNLFAKERFNIRNSLMKTDLSTMKRRLIGQWIDRKCLFGNKLYSAHEEKIELDV